MTGTKSWIVLFVIMLTLLSSCTAMAGNVDHWPASLVAVAVMVAGKFLNDRFAFVKWPTEFLFWAAMTLIFCNLSYLYWTA
jgi:hypothetical protein